MLLICILAPLVDGITFPNDTNGNPKCFFTSDCLESVSQKFSISIDVPNNLMSENEVKRKLNSDSNTVLFS